MTEVISLRPTTSLSVLHVYMPLENGEVINTCSVLMNDQTTPIFTVVMTMLFTPDVRILLSGSVQVMVGPGRPEAVQLNVAVLGDVTIWDEGYSVMLAATVTKIKAL